MKEIIVATKNKGKAKEFQSLFEPYGITIKTLHDFSNEMPDIEETGSTFQENARLKAEGISKLLKKPVIADDSGLEVRALDGRPGVYSARFAGEPTDDSRNNDKLLRMLNDIPSAERQAQFTCVLALSIPDEDTIYAKGSCEGKIATGLTGEAGFGYDPLFIPNGYTETMAQLGNEEKNKISHRYHALKVMEQTLQEKGWIGEPDA
ncbi:MAG TPA: XTP/dITP diphosphatase [Pseudogracilibacillus sp.]|nr:XTP/dITP diphosphatase [Pseudogracilibacillus sp.]